MRVGGSGKCGSKIHMIDGVYKEIEQEKATLGGIYEYITNLCRYENKYYARSLNW